MLFDSDRWRDPLTFRDRLRSNPVLRDEYAALKSRLTAQHPNDCDAYTDGKSGLHQGRSRIPLGIRPFTSANR
ncbi:hypothetical protein GCM10023339_46360 [Alloalcanivorax gelatiniphagus]